MARKGRAVLPLLSVPMSRAVSLAHCKFRRMRIWRTVDTGWRPSPRSLPGSLSLLRVIVDGVCLYVLRDLGTLLTLPIETSRVD